MKVDRLIAGFAAVVLALWLTMAGGCGWQLRGVTDMAHLESVELQGASTDLRQPLVRMLRDRGVTVGKGGPTLSVRTEDWQRRTVSVDERSRTAGAELRYTIRWQLLEAEGAAIGPQRTLRVLRHLDIDPARPLASDDEERTLRKEMHEEAALQILRELERLHYDKTSTENG